MKCEKCQDQGHYPLDRGGITEQFCDCEAGEKFKVKTLAEMGIPIQVEFVPEPEMELVPESVEPPKKRKAANLKKRKHGQG